MQATPIARNKTPPVGMLLVILMTSPFSLAQTETKRPLLDCIHDSRSGVSAVTSTVTGHWCFSSKKAFAPNWRAQWVWMPESEAVEMLLARKTFTLSVQPERAVLSLTASSRYELFINGEYICSGPARCAPHHQSFDVLDITDTLRKGKNALAIRVHHQQDAVSYYGGSRAGLLAQLDCSPDAQQTTIQTDASWRVASDSSWLNASPRMAMFHLEVCDRVDLRSSVQGWNSLDFNDKGWIKANVLKRKVGWPLPEKNHRPTHLTPPWTSLIARDIPYLTERASETLQPVHVTSIPAPQGETSFSRDNWIDAEIIRQIPVPEHAGTANSRQTADVARPITIAANAQGECRAIVFDLGEVQNGRPFLDIAAPDGTVVDIVSAPYLVDGNLQSPMVASTYVDRIVLSGQRERWQAFYMKPTRWLAVVFRHLPKEARLFRAGIVRSNYPFEQKGYFRVPDYPEIQTLWDASAKTIQVCVTDAYTDNYRERRQYAQTGYYACLGNYSVFGDHALQRRYLKQIAEEQLANGLMPAYAPRHGDDFMVILDANCFWIRGLHQYLLYSGDGDTLRDLLPNARKLLELLHRYTSPDGLIDDPPYPYWLDHALNDRQGANFCLNAHYLAAIEDFTQILQWLDEPDIGIYKQRAEQIRRTLRGQLWDQNQQLFADALIAGERSDQFSEHANAMAMALKLASPKQMQSIAAQLQKNEHGQFVRRDSGTVMVTPAMSHFLHAGLCEAGCLDESLDLLWARFSHMLTPPTNGTLWEEWWLNGSGRKGVFTLITTGRSDAQTESAFFPGLFSRYILGIEPTQPGLREVVLHYHHSNRLHQRHGAIPTPSGPLEVAWDVSPTQFKISLQTPPNLTLRIDLASLGSPSPDKLSIDHRPPVANQIKNGFLILSAGKQAVQIER